MAGLLNALLDPRFRQDVKRGLLDSANRGAVAGLLGGPVDLATMAMRPFGYSVEKPVGGSEWIGQKMQDAGMVSGNRNMLAEILAGGALPVVAVSGANALARALQSGKIPFSAAAKSPRMSAPKPTPARPFSDDYGEIPAGSNGSALATDIDRRPLMPGAFIAGRRVVGGVDQGASPADADRIARALGFELRKVSPRDIGGDAGRFVSGGDRNSLLIADGLDESQTANVLMHELGHGVEHLTYGSKIPQNGTAREAATVFSDLNSTTYVPKGKIGATPQSQGYRPDEWESERMAEAIRAYLQDPNYIKTVAPKLAARIREYVNSNANLNRVVQFNSAAGLGLLGAAGENPAD